MSIRALLRVLAASAFLLLPAAPSVAEKAPPPSPATVGKSVKTEIAKARALMKLRRYDLALVVLRPLVQDPGHRDSVLFLTGIAALEHSQKEGREAKSRDTLLSEAIAYFRTMLIRNPGLVRVRLELARAFFLKGEDDLARRHFEQVLAGKPSAQVVVNVNRFLDQIRARKRGGLRVGMALTPDRIPAAPSVAEKVPPPSPATAGGTQEAKALARAGRFEEALAMLRPLAAANPGDLKVRFQVGMAAMGASQRPGLSDDARDALLDEAVAALRTMLIDRPDLVRVRLELARAFFFQGKDSLAREHFERVLAGDLPPSVIENVQRFPRRDPGPPALELLLRRGPRPGQQHRLRLRRVVHQHPRVRLPPPVPPRCGGAHHFGGGALALDRRRVPASPRRPGPDPGRGQCLPSRVRGRGVRSYLPRLARRAALARRREDGHEPPRKRPAEPRRRHRRLR